MAKTQATAVTGREVTAAIELSARVRKAVDGIRQPFTDYVAAFKALTTTRAELAPKFMKAFALWAAEQPDGQADFTMFVRFLDPSVPESRAEYRLHAAYIAADNLRSLNNRMQRQARAAATTNGETAGTAEQPAGGRLSPVSHVTAIARLLKAVAPLLSPETQPMLWAALQSQLGWSENQVKRIQNLVSQVDPLVVIREPRNVHAMGQLRLRLPEPAEREAA